MRLCAVTLRSAARLVAAFMIALPYSAALSQNPTLKTRSKEEREERSSATHRIVMNVQVTNASGNPVSDLRAEEFSLYDNQKARKIVAFHPIDGAALSDATEILILLDAVNTPAEALDREKNAIFRYLAESRKPFSTPTAFALWFNGHLSVTPATTDRNEIGRAFVKLTRNVHSNACGAEQSAAAQKATGSKSVDPATCRSVHFTDSVAAIDGLAQQQLATGGRTLLLWMGSGWPALPDAELQLLPTQQRDAYVRKFLELMHDLRSAQVTVYVISADGNSAGVSSEAPVKASAGYSPAALPRLDVAELARRTGGLAIDASGDIVPELKKCVRDAEWYYSVAFNAPQGQNGLAEKHSLEIKIARPDLEVRTLSLYYSEP